MAEVIRAITELRRAHEVLLNLASQTQTWRHLSDRLFDIKEAMNAAELTLESWRRKFDIQNYRPIIYMQVLFGRQGYESLERALRDISDVTQAFRNTINKVIGQALKVRTIKMRDEDIHSAAGMEILRSCISRIQENRSWSHRFILSVLQRAEDMELHVDKLHRKVTVLERISDYFLEKEHPEIFSDIKRLPGRGAILKIGSGRMDVVQNRLLDALAARKDAQLLYHSSGHGDQIHIGLSVPQILDKDFAFLLDFQGRTHDLLVHPVTIKASKYSEQVPTDLISTLRGIINENHHAEYLLPSASTSAGFEVKFPPTNLLSDLEYKDPISTLVRDQNASLGAQTLYPRDQSALASGIAQGSFRLIGSPWLDFLDSTNVRWRRTTAGFYTSMLTARPGVTSTTRSLRHCISANLERRDIRDLSKHAQIFRIGLVLAEIVLKTPISFIDYNTTSDAMRIHMDNGDVEDATELAAEAERKGSRCHGG
ncbi:hypothetical protein NX059_012548 [Plenodomus lindquistii]|nr:hypothetical protein NX059_012548 [Plenodomus lindquistii]